MEAQREKLVLTQFVPVSNKADAQNRLNQFFLTKDFRCFSAAELPRKNHIPGESHWRQLARTGQWDYAGCLIEEFGELQASLGIAHYRGLPSAQDFENAIMELVDCLHFILSAEIQKTVRNTTQWSPKYWDSLQMPATKVEMRQQIQEIIRLAAIETPATETQEKLMRAFGILICQVSSWINYQGNLALLVDHLYTLKYNLNIFRQANGYSKGTYLKKNKNGQEDNALLMSIAAHYRNEDYLLHTTVYEIPTEEPRQVWQLFLRNYCKVFGYDEEGVPTIEIA